MAQTIKIGEKNLTVEDGDYALVDAIKTLTDKVERLSMVMG